MTAGCSREASRPTGVSVSAALRREVGSHGDRAEHGQSCGNRLLVLATSAATASAGPEVLMATQPDGGRAVTRLPRPSPLAALPVEVLDSTLYTPTIRLGVIPRPQLLARLRAAGAVPTVAAVAPAGYGKTTLLALWAEADDCPFAWLPARLARQRSDRPADPSRGRARPDQPAPGRDGRCPAFGWSLGSRGGGPAARRGPLPSPASAGARDHSVGSRRHARLAAGRQPDERPSEVSGKPRRQEP
jgi:hypothetical protein